LAILLHHFPILPGGNVMQSNGSFRLIVRRGPQPNQIYELNKDIITLGRDITNDIVINDPECSRHHCRLTRGGGGYTIEDLGSTNGTFVNGQRLTGARPLSGGDVVGLGETVTLGYESTIPAAEPGQQPTMVGSTPAQPAYQQPSSYQQAPQQQYAPPAPPAPQYQYQEPAPSGGGLGRWFFIGCGCLIVLCIVLAGIAVLILSTTHGGCDISLLRSFYNTVGVFGTCPAP
jgi:hypothetical protein